MTTNDETLNTPAQSGDTTDPGKPAPEGQDTASAGDSVAAERDQLRDQLLRMAADFDNYRKRTRREIDEAKVRGRDDAFKDLLPVFDYLELAVRAAAGAQTVQSVVQGVEMVLKEFGDTVDRMKLTRVKTTGERFDPAIHDAIQQQETDEHPPGTIVAEIAGGYMDGQRLLRPAKVVVARKASKPADAEGAQGSAGDVSRGNGAAEGSGNGH